MAHREFHLIRPRDGTDDRDAACMLNGLCCLILMRLSVDLIEDDAFYPDVRVKHLEALDERCRTPGDASGVDHENGWQRECLCDTCRRPAVGEGFCTLIQTPDALYNGDVCTDATIVIDIMHQGCVHDKAVQIPACSAGDTCQVGWINIIHRHFKRLDDMLF